MLMYNRLLVAIFILYPSITFCQTTYIASGGKEQWLLNRMEIKLQTNNDFNLSTVKPYLRNIYVRQTEIIDSLLANGKNPANFSRIDQYNLDRFLANHSECTTHLKDSWKSTHPWGKSFYQTKGAFIESKDNDFYLNINPAILQQQGREKGNSEDLFINSKGVTARGMVGKVGFNFYAIDNQERGPLYEQAWVASHNAVPGNGFYKAFKVTGQDYFDARGSTTWNVGKYVNMQFGYDKNFIGDGYRSLFLSEFSSSYLFLKFNTRFWKINYTNIFMQLNSQFSSNPGNVNQPEKYASMHHFSMNVTPWLNLGAFESTIFGKANHFEITYLTPVIFLHSFQGKNDNPNNDNVGFDFKANLLKKIQLYGQLYLDEFNLASFTKDPTNAENKEAYQLGIKYVDALGVQNLDLQLEYNSIRPFTYQHNDTIANVTHYNQPMADPLGANVKELIGIARYQPLNKLYITGKAIYYMQGLDSAGINFGSNPLESYSSILNGNQHSSGYAIGSGNKAKCAYLSFDASYEIKENLFIDGSGTFRTYKTAQAVNGVSSTNTSFISIGIRWNMSKREYDY